MPKKLTYEIIKDRLNLKGFKLLDREFKNNGTRVNIEDGFGYKYFVTPNSVNNGYTPEPFNKANPHTIENIKLFFIKNGGIIPNIEEYKGSNNTYLLFNCKECQEEVNIKWSSVFNNKNFKFQCHKCNHDDTFKDIKYTLEYMKIEFKKFGYTITDNEYRGNNKSLNCIDKDGYKVKLSYTNLKLSKSPYKFSTKFNKDNYIYNINNFFKINNIKCEAVKYIEDKIAYENYKVIICKCECGEEFETCWASIKAGKVRCSKCVCNMSKIEKVVSEWLDLNKIKYSTQKMYDDLKYDKKLRFDFYLPEYNCCIETDGIQHYIPVKYSNNMNENEIFRILKICDNLKEDYCKNNNIKFIRLSYNQILKNEEYIEILSNKLIKE